MSRFASRRNFYAEEQVLLQELVTLLDAREVPSDPIRKAQFWADYYRTGLTAAGDVSSQEAARALSGSHVPRPAAVSPVQDPLFPDMEDAA